MTTPNLRAIAYAQTPQAYAPKHTPRSLAIASSMALLVEKRDTKSERPLPLPAILLDVWPVGPGQPHRGKPTSATRLNLRRSIPDQPSHGSACALQRGELIFLKRCWDRTNSEAVSKRRLQKTFKDILLRAPVRTSAMIASGDPIP
ncbi:predicted protein [Histoplasma capsulatum H143]|uniref:Uncharacterized protein n=1 Tax=Ajellomyces capsulatus (strain H143) TaxID=544712 RepID=C6H581_AJECH|nr:predicted protein [Histoplasma capsulatum H143]